MKETEEKQRRTESQRPGTSRGRAGSNSSCKELGAMLLKEDGAAGAEPELGAPAGNQVIHPTLPPLQAAIHPLLEEEQPLQGQKTRPTAPRNAAMTAAK